MRGRARRTASTCERLRAAAAPAVLMAGGAKVTMADLAAAAGVPASAAPGHCPEGAAAVVADAYRRASGELFVEYAASFRLADSWPEKLGVRAAAHAAATGRRAGGRAPVLRRAGVRRRGAARDPRGVPARYVELLATEQDRHARRRGGAAARARSSS